MPAAGVLIPLIGRLALRHLARRRAAAAVAVLGLACGVAAVTATQLLYASVVASYEATTRKLAGHAALVVTNGESGVPEELLDELQQVSGVRMVAASVEGFVATPDLPGDRLYLYGVDLLADQGMRDYGAGADAVVSDPMLFLAASDSVALTGDFMRTHGLGMGDRIRVLAPAGAVELTIRAMLGRQEGPATALDGRLAVVDLSVAQELLRLDRRVSQLAIDVEPGADVPGVERAVAARVGSRATVEPPRSRAASFARLLVNYRNGLVLAAALAMLVALYFVVNVATVAVEERRRELAFVRLVGASARVVATLVVVELAALSGAATLLGVPLGVALARALSLRFGAGIAALYGDVGVPTPYGDFVTLGSSAAMGLLLPILAAVGPLRRAVRVHPLEATRSFVPEIDACKHASGAGAAVGGGLLAAVATAVWCARTRVPLPVERSGMLALLGATAGVAAVLPWLVRVLAGHLEAVTVRFEGPLLLLAARNAAAERRRIAFTYAALLASLAGTIAVATWISSLDATMQDAFNAVFAGADLVVGSGADPFASDALRMPASVATDLAQWRDVAFVDAVRIDTIAFGGSRATILASDAAAYVDGRRRLVMVDGNASVAARELVAGTGVVVNSSFARRFGKRPGDSLELATPEGLLRLRVVGIHLELTPGDLGAIRLDRALYRRWWRDDSVNVIEVGLRRASQRARVADAIRARWGARHGLVVFTVAELRRTYRAMLGRLTALVRPLLIVSLGCALVGVGSAGAAATIRRRRTYAALRAGGLTRSQLAMASALELGALGAIAGGAAALVGSVLGWVQVEVLLRGMLGLSVRWAYPRGLAFEAVTTATALTCLVGWVLGRRAGRFAIAEALRWE